VENADRRLDRPVSGSLNETLQRHLSWGLPTSNKSTCLLAHEDYVIGYSENWRLPLWAAFIITPVSLVVHCLLLLLS